jgi:hypothetical protein
MSKKVFYVNYLEDVVRHSLLQDEEDLEEKLTSSFVVIHPQPNLSFYNTFIKLPLEVSIPLVKVHQLSVSQYTSPKTQKLRKSFLRVEHSFYQIEESAASMSSIRWMITQELFFMRLWSNKLFPLPRLVLFAH